MLKKIDHVGITVRNLDESTSKYKKIFQTKVKYFEIAEEYLLRLPLFRWEKLC